MDRCIQKVIGAHDLNHLHPFGQIFLCFFQKGINIIVYFCRIRSCRLKNHTGNTRMTIHSPMIGIAFLAHLYIGNFFQLQHFAIIRRPDHNFPKLFRSNQTPFILHCILISFIRVFSEWTGSRFNILFSQHLGHIRWNQFILGHHVRLHPDTHTIVTPHNHHITHTLDTKNCRFQINTDIVGQEFLIIRIIRTI